MLNNKVDYNNFASTFSKSRQNLKWKELNYFFSNYNDFWKILDIWCGSGRLLWELLSQNIVFEEYLWVDLSKNLLEEAKKTYQDFNFLELNMLNIDELNQKFDTIFLIASFHHLSSIDDRILLLKKLKNILKPNWKIFFTNWSLSSSINYEKYNNSIISNSKNQFWSQDYDIKIWEYSRYYHDFSLEELTYLFLNTSYEILENRLFDNLKNIISIIKDKS